MVKFYLKIGCLLRTEMENSGEIPRYNMYTVHVSAAAFCDSTLRICLQL